MPRIGYLDEAAPAEFLDARVEELARIIASKAPIAMRGMKHVQRDRAQQARRSRRRPPHREGLHGDKVREGCAALAEKRPRRF
jgi:enoyl-CoA hydratase/carnithine racemase